MVPVTVHQVFRDIGVCLVEGRISVGRLNDLLVLYCADVENVALVRRKLELADSGRDVTQSDLLAEPVATDGSLVKLSSLKEEDALPVR